MRVHVREGALVLEGPAELEAAMLVCEPAARLWRRRDRGVRERARRIIEDAAKVDAVGSWDGTSEPALPLALVDALLVVDASRRFTPPVRRIPLQGDDEIVAAARRPKNRPNSVSGTRSRIQEFHEQPAIAAMA